MKARIRLLLYATAVLLYAALGWVAGVAILAVGLVLVVRRAVRARRALAPTLACPWCGERVAQYGGFGCGNCRARTLGWAWRCRICSAWAGHVECPACGMSVRNPLLGSP